MLFTVITICKNEKNNIGFTLDSVLKQTLSDFQYVVVDGNSKDGTLDIINNYKDKFIKRGIDFVIKSSNDGGIYPAMNNGISLANGEYCIFMNAGDAFHDSNVLRYISLKLKFNKVDVLYGDTVRFFELDKKNVIEHADHRYIPWGCTICHQSSFIKTNLLKERSYCTRYKLASDYEYWQYLYSNKKTFRHTRRKIAYFRDGGASSKNFSLSQTEAEKIINEYTNKNKVHIFVNNRHNFIFDYKHNNFNKGQGWSIPEWKGTWTIGDKTDLFVKLNNEYDLYCEINVLIDNGYNNCLYINDKKIATLYFYNGKASVLIKREYITNGINTLSIRSNDLIRYEDEIYPNIPDHRRCNLHVRSIKFTKNINDSIPLGDYLRIYKNGYIRRYGFSKKDSFGGIWCICRHTIFDILIKNTEQKYTLSIEYDNSYKKDIIVIFNNKPIGELPIKKSKFIFQIDNKTIHKGLNTVELYEKKQYLNKKNKPTSSKYLYIKKIKLMTE